MDDLLIHYRCTSSPRIRNTCRSLFSIVHVEIVILTFLAMLTSGSFLKNGNTVSPLFSTASKYNHCSAHLTSRILLPRSRTPRLDANITAHQSNRVKIRFNSLTSLSLSPNHGSAYRKENALGLISILSVRLLTRRLVHPRSFSLLQFSFFFYPSKIYGVRARSGLPLPFELSFHRCSTMSTFT